VLPTDRADPSRMLRQRHPFWKGTPVGLVFDFAALAIVIGAGALVVALVSAIDRL
jgi:hypothetical protein